MFPLEYSYFLFEGATDLPGQKKAKNKLTRGMTESMQDRFNSSNNDSKNNSRGGGAGGQIAIIIRSNNN